VLARWSDPAVAQSSAHRLADIRLRGVLTCGIWPEVRGFAARNEGVYSGFDVDICRAFALSVLGDVSKTRFVELAHIADFKQRDDIDLVVRRLTWTLGREASQDIVFGPVTFYDGQTFLVPKEGGIKNLSALGAGPICVLNRDHHPETLINYLQEHNQQAPLVLVENDRNARDALVGRRCLVYSADMSWLAGARASFEGGVDRYDILPQLISKEPLAPVIRREDADLVERVRLTFFALLEAEELGVNSKNAATLKPNSPRLRHFLDSWVRTLIAGIGNYGEIFDRNLGAASPIKLDRGLNRLWTDGGLMYAPPLD
jgi:general L-amino acid transport system substrate-binding protein